MRTVRDIPILENIPVLLRISQVNNSARLAGALPTIEYLRKRHARVILMSHVSGTGTETLQPMLALMRTKIPDLGFCPVATGPEARAAVRDVPPGGVLLLENLRRNAGEEKNDPAFAEELASLGDVFVEDAFDTCHRKHASIVTLPTLLPAYAGLTVEKEVSELTKALKPKRPAFAVISGVKFSTKEPILRKLIKTYDRVAVGGALANDFLKAAGYLVGTSLVSDADERSIKEMLKNKRLVMPVDVIVAPMGAKRAAGRIAELSDVRENEAILDFGPKTAELMSDIARTSKTVLWNGPLGNFENGFSEATETFARAVAESKAYSIVGGGDTIAAIEKVEAGGRLSFISTGGGAMLDFLAEGTLPGIEALD